MRKLTLDRTQGEDEREYEMVMKLLTYYLRGKDSVIYTDPNALRLEQPKLQHYKSKLTIDLAYNSIMNIDSIYVMSNKKNFLTSMFSNRVFARAKAVVIGDLIYIIDSKTKEYFIITLDEENETYEVLERGDGQSYSVLQLASSFIEDKEEELKV